MKLPFLPCLALLSVFHNVAMAEPITFIWHNGLVATNPYYGSNFLPATSKSINDIGVVTGAVIATDLYRTTGTWDGESFTSLGSLPGFPESFGNGLNNHGTVVGGSINGGLIEPTAWRNGQILDLGTVPGSRGGFADAINEKNEAVGFTYAPQGPIATLWRNGPLVLLNNLLGHIGSEATDINESGTIVGYSGNQAVTWTNGQIFTLPGCSTLSTAYAINDSGQAVGHCGSDAVLWANGLMTVVGPDIALGIDNTGTVIGRTSDFPLTSQTYTWTANSGLEILPGFVWSEPFSISSDNSYIVGFGELAPEPSTMLLLLAGLIVIVCKARYQPYRCNTALKEVLRGLNLRLTPANYPSKAQNNKHR